MKGKLFFICSFLLFLLLPSVLMLTDIEDSYKENENRKLAKLKFTSLSDVKMNIINLKNYYSDNFGTRFILYNFYNEKISKNLKESPLSNKVIYGKKDWLFLGNSFNNVFSEVKGDLIFTKKELFEIEKNILRAKDWCDQKKIEFYICVVPSKHTIYKEYLPYKINVQETKLDQFIKIFPKTIDLRACFLKKKKEDQLYYKTDAHWNQIGAFYGYKQIMKSLTKNNSRFSVLKNENIDYILNDSIIGDISRILGKEKYEKKPNIILKNKLGIQINKEIQVPSYHRLGANLYEERYYNNEALNKRKIMFLRDSFTANFVHFFRATFNESIFIYNHKFDKEIIIKEQPNILVYEIAERFIENLNKIHE